MMTLSSPKGFSTFFYTTVKEGKNGFRDESLVGAEAEEG
jgi:hypothetical protein